MKRIYLNDQWRFGGARDGFAALTARDRAPVKAIDLPHDAMIATARDAAAPSASSSGYHRGASYVYRRTLTIAEPEQRVYILEFEGVYMNAQVYINGQFACACPSGYSHFHVDLAPYLVPGDNEIQVLAYTGAEPNSRWYSGGGIYRDVVLYEGALLHLAYEGLTIRTPQAEAELAVVEVESAIRYAGRGRREARLELTLVDAEDEVVGREVQGFACNGGETLTLRTRMTVPSPRRWSVEEPHLYRCRARILDAEDVVIDEAEESFGIRKLELDAAHGLRINGVETKLRGACIHHDNGILGAATFHHAEARRVRLLKEAGFNASRMAHHPMSKALLDACDLQGMLVMDELTDMWNRPKSDYDYGQSFRYEWERDVERMVAKDRNRPSVILYSIGNEITELSTDTGVRWARAIAERIRALDPTRYVTCGTNLMLASIDAFPRILRDLGLLKQEVDEDGIHINQLMTDYDTAKAQINAHPLIGELTEQSFAALDVAGYNYAHTRYEADHVRYPNRIIVGSETFPPIIDEYWALVTKHPWIIGDFTWTGWDYIGEAGIGAATYEGEASFSEPYPYYLANCGDIDITGFRRPLSYLREIVFGLRDAPYIASFSPEHHGQTPNATPWVGDDVVASWNWPGYEEQPVRVAVYSSADEVELLLNGRSLGRQLAGPAHAFRAYFELTYEPGELRAINWREGQSVESSTLVSAGECVALRLQADLDRLEADPSAIAFVSIELVDGEGRVQPADQRAVTVTVEGAGSLQGFGSADPQSEERFSDTTRTPWYGRLLAAVRAASTPGTLRVRAQAEGLEEAVVEIAVE